MPSVTQIHAYLITYSRKPRITLVNSNQPIGELVFVPSGTELPSDSMLLGGTQGILTMHYHLEHFPLLLDILRNEKPVQLIFNGIGPTFTNFIATQIEPVGEAES